MPKNRNSQKKLPEMRIREALPDHEPDLDSAFYIP